VVAQWFGNRPKIVLHAFGGLTFPGQIRNARQDIAVSVAGSLTQILLLGLPAFLLLREGAITSYNTYVIVHDIQWVSLGWAIINLLPLFPLDGGNVALTLLRRSRRLEAERLARQISVGTALGLAIWMYQSIGMLSAVWVLYFGVLNAVALAKMSPVSR
jgi:Zn-dependent protease